MRIAFFTESYKPYLSGVTNSAETLKKELDELGHETYVFAPDYPDAEKTKDIYRYPSIKALYPGYRLAIPKPFNTLKFLKEKEIDIIHSHSPYQLGLLSMWCAKKLKVPYVYTMHTIFGKYLHYIPVIPNKVSDKAVSFLLRKFANKCSTVIVPTPKAKEYLESTGANPRIEVVPTGIDLKLFQDLDGDRIREKHNIPKTDKLLIFVGRLAKEKNVSFLLRSFKLILEQIKNSRLMLVAGGPLQDQLKKEAADLGVLDRTIFTGEVSYPEVLNYYAAADLFVFSSITETQGLVLPEAMAAGTPAVAVDSEGVSDMVENGVSGYLVELNEHIFAEKVVTVLNDTEGFAELKTKTIKYVEKFSSKTFAKKIESIYSSLIK